MNVAGSEVRAATALAHPRREAPRDTLRCGACRSSNLQAAYEVNGTPIMKCASCGSGRALLLSHLDPASIYNSSYFAGGQHDGYADYLGSKDVVGREFRTSLRALSRHTRSGRLLEVGCAYGFFLEQARAHFDVVGVDVAEEAIAHCKANGLEAYAGVVDRALLERVGKLDAVVMLDVIEHLELPDKVLSDIAGGMKSGGCLLLTTGDFGSLVSRAMGSKWRLMTPPQHLHFFTVEGMRQMLDLAGFDIVDIRHPWKTVPLRLIAYQLLRSVRLQDVARKMPLGHLGIPVNLFDAMRVIATKR